jgi:hypothetical protein
MSNGYNGWRIAGWMFKGMVIFLLTMAILLVVEVLKF